MANAAQKETAILAFLAGFKKQFDQQYNVSAYHYEPVKMKT